MKKYLTVLLLLIAWVGCSGSAENAPTPAPAPVPSAPKPAEAKAMSPQSCRFSATFQGNIPVQAPGNMFEVAVIFKNTSTETWPGDALASSDKPLCAAYHLYASPGEKLVLREGLRTKIPSAVAPGEEISLVLKIKAPDAPGKYFLEPDIVQERVIWFGTTMKDSPLPRLAFEVKAPKK